MVRENQHNDPTLVMTVSVCEQNCETYAQSSSLFYVTGAKRTVSTTVAGLPVFEEYELLEEIGRGGMGIVYKARDPQLGRVVAVKLLLPWRALRAEAIAQFLAEAAIASELHHPGIVQFEAAGCSNGQPYICMELVEGESLDKRLSRSRLDAAEAAQVVAAVADAVQHMHDRQIIHRDLKPANILLDQAGQPRLVDFSLAMKLRKQRGSQSRQENSQERNPEPNPVAGPGRCPPTLTMVEGVQSVQGTLAYMSPEQASGEISAMRPASDVYALGVVLFESLTGRTPFCGTQPMAILAQVIQAEPPSPRSIEASIPEVLERIVLRCLQKDPARRYASAAELADELRRFAGQLSN